MKKSILFGLGLLSLAPAWGDMQNKSYDGRLNEVEGIEKPLNQGNVENGGNGGNVGNGGKVENGGKGVKSVKSGWGGRITCDCVRVDLKTGQSQSCCKS